MTNHIYASLYNGILFKIIGMDYTNITGSWPINSQITNIIEHNGKLVIGINGAEKDSTQNLFGSTFISADSGTTWTNISGNMPCTHIYGANTLQAINNDLYAATYGGGIHKSIGLITGMQEMSYKNENIFVFPNPAQNKLIIEIQFDVRKAELDIFNSTGQIIKSYSNINSKQISIETTDLNNGLYFFTLQNGDKQVNGKFIISK